MVPYKPFTVIGTGTNVCLEKIKKEDRGINEMQVTGKREAFVSLGQSGRFVKKAYAKAIIPCMLSIVSGNMEILVDGILVGRRLGGDALAAVNLSLPVCFVLCAIGSLIVSGTAVCAGEAIAEDQFDRAQAFYQTAIFWCSLTSAAVMAAGLLCLEPLAMLLCRDGAVAFMVMEYTGVTLAGALPKILIYIPFWYLKLDGRDGKAAVTAGVMGAGNILLDIVFLYVLDMGVLGAALASVASTGAACILGFAWLCDKNSSFLFGYGTGDEEVSIGSVVRAGSPWAMGNLFRAFRVMVLNGLFLKSGGRDMVAVFAAVNGISALEEKVINSISKTACSLSGIYSGKHDSHGARLVLVREVKRGVPYCLVFSAAILGGSRLVARAYGLSSSLRLPLASMALGMVFAMGNGILSRHCYLWGHARWANAMLCLKTVLLSCASLALLAFFGQDPWWFLFWEEAGTLTVWLGSTGLFLHFHPGRPRFLQTDNVCRGAGKAMDASVKQEAKDNL